MLKFRTPPRNRMDRLITVFSRTDVSDAATLIYPQILNELKTLKNDDKNLMYKLKCTPENFAYNVFYFYYMGIIRDVKKVRSWAQMLHTANPELFAEWNIYRRVRSNVHGRVSIINPETNRDYLTANEYTRLFDNTVYTPILAISNNKPHYVISEDYKAERSLYDALHGINKARSGELAAISFSEGGRLSRSQNNVIRHINANNLTIMTGGAGTGKTSVIIHLINDWYHHDRNFGLAIVSPTNMAAENIRDRLIQVFDEKILERVFIGTIHRYTQNPKHPDYSLIIFEETSMYDNILAHMCELNKTNVYNCKYLFAGDQNQLPPVSRSSLLCRMIKWFSPYVVTLHENFRSGDLIVNNSQSILLTANASFAYLKTGENFKIYGFTDIATTRFLDYTGKFNDEVMFITYRARDSLALNEKIQKELLEGNEYYVNTDPGMACLSRTHPVYHNNQVLGYWNWRIGDRIRCTINRLGVIYNGSIGQVSGFTNNEIIIRYKDTDVYVHHRYTWPAYCVTVHTAQGKEWDTVVFCDCRNEGLLRSLFYVAITRPKKQAIIMRKKDSSDADLRHFNIIDDDPIMHDEMNYEESGVD